jgi:hypothetical protein
MAPSGGRQWTLRLSWENAAMALPTSREDALALDAADEIGATRTVSSQRRGSGTRRPVRRLDPGLE